MGFLDGIKGSLAAVRKGAQVEAVGRQHTLVEPSSYEFSPAYFYHNGQVGTIVQLYVRKGSNRSMTFSDVLDVIPSNPRDGVRIYFIEQDGIINDDEKKEIVRANALGTREVVENEDKSTEGGILLNRKKDASEREQDTSDIEDYGTYELTLDTPEPVVYFRVCLLIVAQSQEQIEEQIEDLNTSLKQHHGGMEWDAIAGDQYDRFTGLFDELPKATTGDVDTSTGANYAGINFAASPGLCDEQGVCIGDDVLSLVQSSAVFDFENSTGSLAIVAIPSSENMLLYEKEGLPHMSASSIVAQTAANDIVMHGHKAVHLVMNDFDYSARNRGFNRVLTNEGFDFLDCARVTINPLQGFGEVKDVSNVYNRLTRKIVNLFDILNDFRFERDTAKGMNYQAIVMDAVNHFYTDKGLWSSDAMTHPERTQIVNIKEPAAYPTMGELVQSFTNYATGARAHGSVEQADAAEALKSILDANITAAMSVLGSTTTISPSTSLQTYYMFKELVDVRLRQVQFINLLEYVFHTLQKGDVLVLHGLDGVYREVMTMARDTIVAAQKRGIRVIMAFDTITSPITNPTFEGLNMSDMFSLRGPYYTDFDSDVSWSIVGAMLDEEVEHYAQIMNNANLSTTIRTQATVRGICQGLVHRDVGRVNNFVRLTTLI